MAASGPVSPKSLLPNLRLNHTSGSINNLQQMFEKPGQPEVEPKRPFVFSSDTGAIKKDLNKGNLQGQNFYDKCCLTVNIFTNQLKE